MTTTSMLDWPEHKITFPTRRSRSIIREAPEDDATEEAEFTFEEMRAMCNDLDSCDVDMLENISRSQPLADQRGERVVLDVDGRGALQWKKLGGEIKA